jgi:SRSO17 transposase
MDIVSESGGSEDRFNTYLDALSATLGHADRAAPFQSYCTGLLLPGERKSVEPMAARLEPERVQATHQAMHHVVAKADWSDAAMLTAVRNQVLPAIEQHGAINAWITDDSGFPKKGTHSVGVARQYCGQLGKQDNCQVAVSLSVANDHASLPIAYQLYLPEAWATEHAKEGGDQTRRRKAGVPDDVAFQTKPQIALGQIRTALLAGVPRAVVLADAGYGVDTEFRDGITELGLRYVVGIQSSTTLWSPGQEPLPPKPWSGRGRRPTRLRHDDDNQPVSAKDLALGLPNKAFRRVTWREGSNTKLASRFAAVRVRPAQGETSRSEPRAEEWCLIECPPLPFHWPVASGTFGNSAEGRGRTDPVLVLHPARRHLPHSPRQAGQAALADRARLSGPQAGTRAWPLRRPRLARLSPSCHALYCGLRLPHHRAGRFSPLGRRTSVPRHDTSATRRFPTPRIPRCDLNAMWRPRSPPSASPLPTSWHASWCAAPAANAAITIDRL